MNNISLDDDFINFIKRWEGFRGQAYLDQGNIPTIGYGTTSYSDNSPVKMGDKITVEKALYELTEDCKAYYCHLLKSLEVEQSKNQLIALLSLCYNIGVPAFLGSTLLKKINHKIQDKAELSAEFGRWIYVKMRANDGLRARRDDEVKRYFLT